MNIASTTSLATSSLSFIAHPPLDWVILFVVLLVILVDALRSGMARTATLTVVFPLTFLFLDFISRAAILGPMLEKVSSPLMQAGIFGVLFAVLFFLTYRIMYSLGGVSGMPFVAVIGSLAATIVSLVIWLQVPALQSVWHFSPQIQTAFGDPYAFWWLISSFLLMAFVRS